MKRSAVLTHLSWPAKKFVYATGREALWLGGGALLALSLWNRLAPYCIAVYVPMQVDVPGSATSGPTVLTLQAAPFVGWVQRSSLPAGLSVPLIAYSAWLPLLAASLLLGLVALVTLWEPEGKKVYRWAYIYARTFVRVPRVATYQPRPIRRKPA